MDTFLHLEPALSVILNIDADHLDYFKTLENIIRSFHQFALQTSRLLVVNGDDVNTRKAVEGIPSEKLLTFGFEQGNDYRAVNVADTKRACERFTVLKKGVPLCEASLRIPGKHNIYNALAAVAVADFMGVDAQTIAESLHQFTGVHRRFEILGTFDGVTVADDFAHHPTELTATLTAAMQMGFREVWAVFQPHTFSRTYMLLDDFAKALSIPDHAVLSEILPVREVNTYHIYAKDLAEKIPGCVWFPTFEEISDYVLSKAQEGDLILTLGGGDVYKCCLLYTSIPTQFAPDALTYILYLGVFSTMIALLLQTVCQKYVPASKASLILSLESVFGCICGIIFLHEALSERILAGFVLIFGAILLSEVKPAFLRVGFLKKSSIPIQREEKEGSEG